MKNKSVAALLLVLSALFVPSPRAGAAQTLPGLACHTETRQAPPMRLFVAEIDLTSPRVHLRVSPGGPDLDGPGQWQTTLMQPTKIADRDRYDFVINGDFFAARKTKDGEGAKAHYLPDVWATVQGPAVTDGKAWAAAPRKRPCLVVHKNRKVDIELLAGAQPDDWEVIAGNKVLVQDGVIMPGPSKIKNPRTAVGLDATGGKLIILVVDGRKPGVSIGMSDAEMAAEMLRLGCRQAINLDGGGSSVMAVRDSATGRMRILNTPSDGHERAVGNALGITIETAP